MKVSMEPYKKFLSRHPELKSYLNQDIFIPAKTSDITLRLVWSILSQQLSIKVAKVLYQRFWALYEKKPNAKMIQETSFEKLKSIGISSQKTTYIHNVAQFVLDNKVTAKKLSKMSDEEVINFLCQIKGVGRWTVEMLLIFGMGREDVFALDDLGIQKEMIKIFKLHNLNKKELRLQMIELSKQWSPYRSYVCLYLWNFSGFKK